MRCTRAFGLGFMMLGACAVAAEHPAPRDAGGSADAEVAADGGAAQDAAVTLDAGEDPVDAGAVVSSELDSVDRSMLRWASLATTTSRDHFEEIWSEASARSSYHFDAVPLYLVRRSAPATNARGYLVHHRAPPSATIVADDELQTIAPVFRWDDDFDALGDAPFEILANVANTETLAVAYSQGFDPFEDPDDPVFFAFLVHEGFHHYQFVAGGWRDNSCVTQDVDGYPITFDNTALALLENAILRAGVLTNDVAEKEVALLRFLAVRAARRALPEAIVRNVNYVQCMDESQEQLEGTAAYAERKFVRAAGLDEDIAFDIVGMLTEDARLRDAFDVRFYLSFDRFYATGAAVGELLDDTSTFDWRSTCRTGAGPTSWITAAFGELDRVAKDRLVAEAKAANDFTAIESRAQSLLNR